LVCGGKKLTIRKDGFLQNHWAKKEVREKTGQKYCAGSMTKGFINNEN
jgi:hypothetical protein